MKHRTGYLFKRGSSFYLTWKVEGKAFTKALRDESGNAITTKRDAEEARQRLMAPFAVADEAEALQSIAAKLGGVKAELAAIEDEKNPPLPLSQVWSAFIASPNRPDSGEATLYQYECQWSAFASWMKATYPNASTLRDVSKATAEQYAGTLNHGRLSPNTYNKHLNLLTLVFRVVKAKARITDNPWADIQRKRLVTQSRRELTVDELRKVCASAEGELRLLLCLGIYSGMRLGDCSTLRWAEVDVPRNIIRRIPNKTARRNPTPVLVHLHPELRAVLDATPASERGEYVLPKTAALYNNRSDLVTDTVQRHLASCGIKPHKPGTGQNGKRAVVEAGFHSLRHSFVSVCRSHDVPLSVVESIVGHSSPAMTRHYSHTGELDAIRAIASLPALTGEAVPEPTKRDEGAALREAQSIIKSMTAGNWRVKKAELLTLLALNESGLTTN